MLYFQIIYYIRLDFELKQESQCDNKTFALFYHCLFCCSCCNSLIIISFICCSADGAYIHLYQATFILSQTASRESKAGLTSSLANLCVPGSKSPSFSACQTLPPQSPSFRLILLPQTVQPLWHSCWDTEPAPSPPWEEQPSNHT